MNTPPTDGYRPLPEDRAFVGPGEDTLRLIAGLPAPDGLADRVRERIHAAPRSARSLIWRGPLRPPGGWMYSGLVRGFAAAAIVCAVAGGGWRIYSHVQPPVKVEVIPAPVSPMPKGFSLSGDRHVPQTLQGPVLVHPVPGTSEVNVMDKVPAQGKALPGHPTVKKKKAQMPAAATPVQ